MALRRSHRAIVAAFLAVLAMPTVHADSMGTMRATLPEGRTGAAAAQDGSAVYLFLGCCRADEVWKYSPWTDSMEVMQARLHYSPPSEGAVASTPFGIFVFVINVGTYRYDPATDSFEDMGVVVSGMRSYVSTPEAAIPAVAFWDSRSLSPVDCPSGCVHVLVGDGNIWRYDPAENQVSPLPVAHLPYWPTRERIGASLGWDETHAYLFGGSDYVKGEDRFEYTDEVLRYDPAANSAVTLDARLPKPVAFPGVAGGDGSFWVYGGSLERDGAISASITAFNTTRQEFRPSAASLPRPLTGASVVWERQVAYVLGGFGPDECCPHLVFPETILRHDPFRSNVPPVAKFDARVQNESSAWHLTLDGRRSTDPDGEILFWDWSIDNNTTHQGPLFTLSVNPEQSYDVRLRVTDDAYVSNEMNLVIVPKALQPNDNRTKTPGASDGESPAVSTAGILVSLLFLLEVKRRRRQTA